MTTDPLPDALDLSDALRRNLAARYSAAETLMLIFGPVEDIPDVVAWVADDPHAGPPALDDVDRETQRLRDFERALFAAMTWDHPGGGW